MKTNLKLSGLNHNKEVLFGLLQLIIVLGLMFNPWTVFPFTFIIIIIVILMFTYWKHCSLSEVGLKTDLGIVKIVGSALLLFTIIEPIFDFIVQPLINSIVNESPNYSLFQFIAHDSSKYLKYISFIWISAAIGEELLFRGFMFMQLKLIIPEVRYKTFLMILISAVIFSLPHAYQGLSGLLTTFVFGMIFGIVYVKFNYNLWITILLHGFIDSFFITLAYMDKLDYYSIANFLTN